MRENIVLGKGLSKIHFGMMRPEIKEILGEPDEIEKIVNEDLEEDSSEVWHYDELEISAAFDELEDWRLTSLAVSSPDFTFEGVDLIGLSQQEVMDQIELMGLGDVTIDQVSEDEEVNQQIAFVQEASLNLWFDAGKLSEIQWGPFWDEDEDEAIWPSVEE